jgi:hypothetical protein
MHAMVLAVPMTPHVPACAENVSTLLQKKGKYKECAHGRCKFFVDL